MLSGLRKALQVLVKPFPPFSLLPGGYYSRLDTVAEGISLELVEKFFQNSNLAQKIARAYVDYLEDVEAERALKKGYHVAFEQRLRTVALRDDSESLGLNLSSDPHPLDPHAGRSLTDCDPEFPVPFAPGFGHRLRHWLLTLIEGFRFLVNAVLILLRYGAKGCEPIRCRIAAPDFAPPAHWSQLKDACVALGDWSSGHLTVVMERGDNPGLRDSEFSTVDPDSMPVPRRAWIDRVLIPGLFLVFRLAPLTVLAVRDSRCLELIAECFRQANASLKVWRIAFNVSFVYYLDNVEYDAVHNVKGIVFRKFGGRLVRWPRSQMDMPGAGLSYLGYDLFLSGGEYQAKAHGASWWPQTDLISVGLMANDRRVVARGDVRSTTTAQIEKHLKAGRRLAVFFGGSFVPTAKKHALEILATMRRVQSDLEDWTVVFKPKGFYQQDFYGWMEADPRLHGWSDEKTVVAIRYDAPDHHPCATNWLIEQMSLGVCLGGSVQVEGLTRGVPVLSHRAFCTETPYIDVLRQYGLHHSDPQALEEALRLYLEDPEAFSIPYGWFRENFDPFSDDQALVRIAGLLLGHSVQNISEQSGDVADSTETTPFEERLRA